MTRNTNARIAGVAYLLYIGVAFPSMVMFGKVTAGADFPARLASVARHVSDLRLMLILDLVSIFCALTLAVTLYGITRDEDNELALFGLVCRTGEGIIGGALIGTNGLLWLATASGAGAPDVATATIIGTLLLKLRRNSVRGWQHGLLLPAAPRQDDSTCARTDRSDRLRNRCCRSTAAGG